jgi:putative transport protein
MLEAIRQLLNGTPLAALMLVVTFGYVAGRIGWRGIEAGSAGGTLGIAILAGYLGLTLEELYGGTKPALTIGQLGFALFIYSVGFEAGPQFLSSLRSRRGLNFVAAGSLVVIFAVALTIGLAMLFGLDDSTAAGVLAGGLTSAPTYAAASEEASDAAKLSVAFALTYPVGLIGLVLMIQLLPRITGTDLSRGAAADHDDDTQRAKPRAGTPELTRAFRVDREEMCGKPLRELDFTNRTGCLISRIHRSHDVITPDAGTELKVGDHVLVVGRLDELQKFEALVGPEVYSAELRERLPAPRRIHVAAKGAVGKSLRDLNLMGRYRCMIHKIERGREALEPGGDVELQRHDVVEVIGQPDAVRVVAKELGRFEPSANTTDIAIYAGGIVAGLLIGSIHFRPLGWDFSLGAAGGLLLVGVLLAWLRNIGPISANVPKPARQLVRDLGILLFVGETGVAAGNALHNGMEFVVWHVIVAGIAVTLLPVLAALLIGRYLLRMRSHDQQCGAGSS